MQIALDAFRGNLNRARDIGGLFTALSQATTPALDLTDLLRAQIVLAVSALDHFIHELVRLGMIETFDGQRIPTAAYRKFTAPLDILAYLATNPHDATPLDQEIRLRHSWNSFQKPDKIAEALRLVSEVRLWEEVAARLAMSMQDVKAQLGAIADRRDRIAHEADIDPTDPSRHTRWPITPTDAQSAVDFMERLGVAILDAIK